MDVIDINFASSSHAVERKKGGEKTRKEGRKYGIWIMGYDEKERDQGREWDVHH